MIVDTRILSHFKGKCVRIFNYFLFLLSLIYSQDTIIHVPSVNADTVLKTIKNVSNNFSQLSNTYKLASFSIDNDESVYKVINTYKSPDSLIFNNINIRNNIMNQILNPYRVTPIGDRYMEIGKDLVSRYYFLHKEPEFRLGLIDKELLGSMIYFSPQFESHLSGIMGMGKVGHERVLNGEINFHLENYFRSADYIDFYWRRKDSLSQVIKLGLSIPHPFGLNTGIDLQYRHEIFSGLYTFMENRFLANTYSYLLSTFGLGYVKGMTKPTGDGILNGYKKAQYQAFSITSKMDNTNDRFLPTNGSVMSFVIDGGVDGKLRFIHGSYVINRFVSFKHNFLFKLKWMGKGIYYYRSNVPKSRYEWFGGTSTIRGYNEQILRSTQYQVISPEIGYFLIKTMQMTIFIDIGSHKLSPFYDQWIGYGIGISQVNEDSILKVEYALPGRSMDGAKLHIKLISRL